MSVLLLDHKRPIHLCISTYECYQAGASIVHVHARDQAIGYADNERIRVQVQNMTVYDLYTADEVFFASTAGGAVPIGQVNGRRIGKEWPGPLTKTMQELYLKEVSKA